MLAHVEGRVAMLLAIVVLALGCGPAGSSDGEEVAFDEEGSVAQVELGLESTHVAFQQVANRGHLVAFDSEGQVYTSPYEGHVFVLEPEGSLLYRIRHWSYGTYLDAYQNGNDHNVVLREYQNNDTQRWYIITDQPASPYLRLVQKSSGRYLDAYTTVGANNRVVTRTVQFNNTQRWSMTAPEI